MNIATAKDRWTLPLVLSAILFCGCASSGSKQGAAGDESQTADTRQVILVPVVILSSPDGDSAAGTGGVAPQAIPPDRSTGNEPPSHSSVPRKL
jgi:hypothetical protein